jgi:hypothetical protein
MARWRSNQQALSLAAVLLMLGTLVLVLIAERVRRVES